MSRIAVVAGGSAGVGRATVDALIERGYRVAVLARGKDRLDEIAAEHGDRVFTRTCNVAEDAQVQKAADEIVQAFGVPDIWINCAMLTSFSPFTDVSEEEFKKITDTTYHGQVNGCRAALRVMDHGNIVCVGSGLAYRSVPYQAAYAGAKHAIKGFTEALRSEILRDGLPIILSHVLLPAINTPQFDWARNRMDRKPQPAPPIFQPKVAVDGIMKAIDEDLREVIIGRSVFQLLFGNMLFPDYIDHKLADMGVEAQKSGAIDHGRADNLDSPLSDYPSNAHGSFDDRAEEHAVTLDSDAARKAVAFGGAALLLALGAIVGRASAGQSSREVSFYDDAQDEVPWGYDRPPSGHLSDRTVHHH